MEAIIGGVVGIIATVLISRYYFKRSVNKNLTPFILTNNSIFAGIDKNVRPNLKFTFQEQEVTDLHQLEFIIANDGEKAISNCIEPLSLSFKKDVIILDSTILYREPQDLEAKVEISEEKDNYKLTFNFPLLNKGEFFLVKLLLSGNFLTKDIIFNILADDLPRAIQPRYLPIQATKDKAEIEWSAVVVGLILVIFGGSFSYALFLLYQKSPELFPFICDSFNSNFISISSIVLWVLGILILLLGGLALAIGVGFEELLQRGPKFILPESMRKRSISIDYQEVYDRIALLEENIKDTKDVEKKPKVFNQTKAEK